MSRARVRGHDLDMRRGEWAAETEFLDRRSRAGVVRVAELEELGVPSSTAYRRCQPDGPWRRLLPGIILLSRTPPSRGQLVTAALVYGRADALLTGFDACAAHGLDTTPRSNVHILVPSTRKLRSSEYVVVERTCRLPEALWRNDTPLAPLVRATLDAARRLRKTDPVRSLIANAIQGGRCSLGALESELNTGGQRGSALPRRVLTEFSAGLRSTAEADALQLLTGSGLPVPKWNVRLFESDGRFIGMPDAWFDDVALAWEIDSYDFHFGPEGYAKTLARNARYAAAGIAVVQTLPSRLRRAPAEVIGELRAAYRAAKARPRPREINTEVLRKAPCLR